MPSLKNFSDSFREFTSRGNIDHSNIIGFDLTRHVDIQLNISSSKDVNRCNYTKKGLNLHITGWACKTSTNFNIEQVLVGSLNGLSIVKRASTTRTVDEDQLDYSMLMLSFDQEVSLISLELGWIKGENNVSLFAFNDGEMNSISDKQWPQLLADGWHSAGDYYNLDYGTKNSTVNPNGIVSKYWLVGSYNSHLGSFFSSNTHPSSEPDHFKLQGVTVSTVGVINRVTMFAGNRLFGWVGSDH